jgi:hypothetical protein
MRLYLFLLLVLGVLITAGCVEEYTPEATVTTTGTPVTATTVLTRTPTPIPTPEPEEMAYLSNIKCTVGDISEAAYHCNGNIRIGRGEYDAVQVIAMYPDNNTFRSGTMSLGGGDTTSKTFAIFPDLKYKGQNPTYYVKMDKTLCLVRWSGSTGVAWSNMPVPPGILKW